MNNSQNTANQNTEHEFNLNKLLDVFRLYWAWILLTVLIFAAVTTAFTALVIDETWSTTVKFNVFISSESITGEQKMTQSEYNAAETHAKTAMEVLKTSECQRLLGINSSTVITTSKISDVPIFSVKVTSTDPQKAFDDATLIRDSFPEYVFEKTHTGLLTSIDFSGYDETPDSPNLVRNVLIGCILGFIVSYVVLFLKIVLDTIIHSEEDVKNLVSYPILGGIPSISSVGNSSNYHYSHYSDYSHNSFDSSRDDGSGKTAR